MPRAVTGNGQKRSIQDLFLKMYANGRSLLASEEAQDLVEYALAFSVVALGAVAGMNAIANSVNDTFIVVTNIFIEALTNS